MYAQKSACVYVKQARPFSRNPSYLPTGAELLKSEGDADRVAAKLTQIAVDHGFDGWLVNIENKVDPGKNVDVLVHFVKSLTAQMRRAATSASSSTADVTAGAVHNNSSSTVLWYDSVTVDGELEWQDRLNGKNRVFFDACDGIFSNYAWKADYPSACALEASARRCVVRPPADSFSHPFYDTGISLFSSNFPVCQLPQQMYSTCIFHYIHTSKYIHHFHGFCCGLPQLVV